MTNTEDLTSRQLVIAFTLTALSSRFSKAKPMPWISFAVTCATVLSLAGCSSSIQPNTTRTEDPATTTSEAEIRAFCGACHVVPQPEMFPQAHWYAEVRRGYEFYYQSDLHHPKLPVLTDVVKYFRSRAPVEFEFPEHHSSSASPIKFRVEPQFIDSTNSKPAISFVAWTKCPDGNLRLRLSDMKRGDIGLFDPTTASYKAINTLCENPAATNLCDLDGDGQLDLVVAELGSFLPADHHHGSVVWIRNVFDEIDSKPLPILENIGRVADVTAADFDGDGDQDLAVAEFGWHRTGGVHVLWNLGPKEGSSVLSFRDELIDRRPGAIHVPTADLNGDGRIDFVGLLSQEFESVIAYINTPDGFQKQMIYAAPDPSVGSSGIELIDFDHDGDLDVLYTNGDTFDSNLLKPCHGIKLLVNEGTFPFKVHTIAAMPGVNRARAADIDADGDYDIIASALVPQRLFESGNKMVDTVVWFEQTRSGIFERHTLKTGAPAHATLEVADMDGDGDLDFVAGCFQEEAQAIHPELLIYWNEGASRP